MRKLIFTLLALAGTLAGSAQELSFPKECRTILDSLAYATGVNNAIGIKENILTGEDDEYTGEMAIIAKSPQLLGFGDLCKSSDPRMFAMQTLGSMIGPKIESDMIDTFSKEIFWDRTDLSLNRKAFLEGMRKCLPLNADLDEIDSCNKVCDALMYEVHMASKPAGYLGEPRINMASKYDPTRRSCTFDLSAYDNKIDSLSFLLGTYAATRLSSDINEIGCCEPKYCDALMDAAQESMFAPAADSDEMADMLRQIRNKSIVSNFSASMTMLQRVAGIITWTDEPTPLNTDIFFKGMAYGYELNDITDDNNPISDFDFVNMCLRAHDAAIPADIAANRTACEQWLSNWGADDPAVTTTDSGIKYRVITPGKGKPSGTKKQFRYAIHYVLWDKDGNEKDNNIETCDTLHELSDYIDALEELLPQMPLGAKWEMAIPHDMAYGEYGHDGIDILPCSAIRLTAEMKSFKSYNPEKEAAKEQKARIKELTDAAKSGNPQDIYQVGEFFYYNDEYKDAMKWYVKGAQLGDADCIYSIGYMYHNGLGVKEDIAKANDYFVKATRQYNLIVSSSKDTERRAYALYMLGLIHNEGYGTPVNAELARTYFKKAADLGNEDAIQWMSENE